MICRKVGNLLDSDCEYICHQVNCQGKMGSGIAGQIKERWPAVYTDYRNFYSYQSLKGPNSELLGSVIATSIPNEDWPDKVVLSLFAQENYGYDGRRYTSYDAFWNCLHEIKEAVPKGSTIGFPEKIGCGLGGANWRIIYNMIHEVLAEDYDVFIYKYMEDVSVG